MRWYISFKKDGFTRLDIVKAETRKEALEKASHIYKLPQESFLIYASKDAAGRIVRF